MTDGEVSGAPRSGTRASRTRRAVWITLAVVVLVTAGIVTALLLQPVVPAASGPIPSPSRSASPTPPPTPTPTPTPTGFPANTTVYDLAALPQIDVFAVNAGLPVDDDPFGALTGEAATPIGGGAPVFGDQVGQPVGFLPREYTFGGTTAPIIERQEHWVRVLLVGRQSFPSQGNPAQVTGWLRTQDVAIAPLDALVEVDLTARTIDIVRAGVPERIATDFASGTSDTPTPLGRTYVMTTLVEPSFGYTRGHPLVYLAVQSPTLDGFGGADVAVTAFHYHDERSGSISNGCLRVDPAAIEALAALPAGTPVIVRP